MTPFDIKSRITGYNLNPHLFTDSQVAEIKEYADIYGIPFDNSVAGAKLAQKSSGYLSQFTSGFTEGFLGPASFGGWAEEPQGEFEAIANSMGHLLGFALPMAGAVVTGGGSAIARLGISSTKLATRGIGAGIAKKTFNQVRRGIGYTGEALQGVGGVMRSGSKVNIGSLGKVPIKSVPMAGADYAESFVKDKLAKYGWEVSKHIGTTGKITSTAKAVDIAFQSGHLAVASLISGSFNGENDELNNIVFGAVAGGAFGGLGNFVTLGKMVKHPNVKIRGAGMAGLFKYSKEFISANNRRLVSMVAGSGFQGGMATMQGAPTATQLYEYLLGGFFGFQAQGASAKQANDYFNHFNSAKNEDGTNKYSFKDIREMTETAAFKELDPEAQGIVKESHFHHLGEMYDSQLSIASATLKETMEADIQLAMRKIAEKKNKDVKDLDKYEKQQAKGEVAELTPIKYENMKVRDRIVNKVYEAIVTDKITPEMAKVIKTLTKAEIKEIKTTGAIDALDRAVIDYFDTKPNKEIVASFSDILKAENSIVEGQPEVSNAPTLRKFFNQLQEVTKNLPNISSDKLMEDAVNLFNKDIIRSDANANQSVKNYVDTLTSRHEGLAFPDNMVNGLKQLFLSVQQNEVRPLVSLDSSSGKVKEIWHKNILNKIVSTLSPKSADEIIHKKLWGDDIKVWEFGEVVKEDGRGNTYTIMPYSERKNFTTGEYESIMTPTDWLAIQKHLWNTKGDFSKGGRYYLKIPKKDSGTERIYSFHPQTRRTRIDTMLKEIVAKKVNLGVAGDNITLKKLQNFYLFDREVWYESMGFIRDKASVADKQFLDKLHKDAFKSNYLYEKNYDFKDAVSRVKREALFSMKSFYQPNPKDFTKLTKGTDEIDLYIINDSKPVTDFVSNIVGKAHRALVKGKKPETYWTKDASGQLVEKAWESKIDGWIVMHSDLHKKFIESFGLDASTSHLKPAVAVEIGGQLFLIKAGVHPGGKAYDKALKNPNSMLLVTSSIKHLPKGTETYQGQARGKTIFDIIGKKGIATKPSLKMPIKDFRINLGVYGDSHSSMSTTIKKQMHSFFDPLTMRKEGFDSFMNDVLDVPLRGTEVNNKYIEELSTNKDLTQPKDFDISKLRDKDVMDIVNDITHPLHREMNLEVFKKIREMEAEPEAPEGLANLESLKLYANSYEQWYKSSGYNPLAQVVNMNLYQRSIHEYRLKRFTQPKWEESSSGWVAGVDPMMEYITGGIKDNTKYDFWDGTKVVPYKVGHVMLGESHRGMRIKWLNDERSTLGEGFDIYTEAMGKNTLNHSPSAIARMRSRLMLAVMRVPANAVSGTRALLLQGFVENNVGVSDYGTYMKGRDHFYIDGADVDGDKVFIYQGLPKEYMQDLIGNDAFLERTQFGKKYFFENKAEKFDLLFGSQLSKKKNAHGISEESYVKDNPISQWSPGALRKAGQSSFIGKQGLGRIVNAKSFLNSALSDIILNKGGVLDIKVYSPMKNKFLGTITGTTSQKFLESAEGYYAVGVEASSRTADSANYFKMANSEQMVDILFRSAFKDLKFNPAFDDVNLPKNATFDMLKNSTEYNQIHDLNQKLYGYNWSQDRNFTIEEVQETLKNTAIDDTYMNSMVTIAKHMSENSMDINPLKQFNFKNLDRAVKILGKNILVDSEVAEFAIRKNLHVKPTYWNIDYKRVFEIMYAEHPTYRTMESRDKRRSQKPLEKIGIGGQRKNIYAEFIWEGLQRKLDPKVQITFDKMYTNSRADLKGFHDKPISKHHATIERDFRINDTWDLYSAIVAVQTGRKLKQAMQDAGLVVEGESKIPYSDINRIAFSKISGEKLNDIDIATSIKWKRKIQEAIDTIQEMPVGQLSLLDMYKTPKSKVENDWLVFRDFIATSSQHIKALFRKGFKDKDSNVYENQSKADELINKRVVDIKGMALKMGIEPRIAVDYFFSHLLGSISPQTHTKQQRRLNLQRELLEADNKYDKDLIQNWIDNLNKNYEHTGVPKFAWQLRSIPDSQKGDFLTGYARMFDLMNTFDSRNPLIDKKIDFFFRDMKTVEKDAPQNTVELIKLQEIKIDRLTDIKNIPKVDQSKVPNDIKNKVLPSIKKTLRRMPYTLTARIDDIYTYMKIEGGFTGTTSIRDATFQDLRNFNRYLKEYIDNSSTDSKWTKLNDYIFPDTVGERMSKDNLQEIYNLKIPVKNISGEKGMANIKVPLSAMSYLQRSSNNIRRVEDAITNQLQENLFNSLTSKQEIEALPNGLHHFQKLLEVAVKDMNIKRDFSTDKTGERKEFYHKEWLDGKKDRDEYNVRTFSVTRKGVTRDITGKELIKDIQSQLNKFFKEEMYESWIGAGLFNEDGVWERIKWERIDDFHDYKDNGLVIHDLIRYNKWGRFDIENFHNKVIKMGSEGHELFGHMVGNRNNPLSVELLNRVQYEVILEEFVSVQFAPNTPQAQNFRNKHRMSKRKDFKTKGMVPNEKAFVRIGEIKDGYFPQTNHNMEKLNPWFKSEQVKLNKALEDHLTFLVAGHGLPISSQKAKDQIHQGKLISDGGVIKKRYRPSEFDDKLYLGLIPNQGISKKHYIEKYMKMQEADFEALTGQAMKESNGGEWGVEYLNSLYRDSKKDWGDSRAFSMRPGTGGSRGEVPMPFFSYSPDVLQTYGTQWVGSFFKNTLSLVGRKVIREYEKNNPLPEEVYQPWSNAMRQFIREQMGHSATLPMSQIGLSKYQIKRIKAYIDANYDNKNAQIQKQIINYEKRLSTDQSLKKNKNVKGLKFAISDQAIIDWLDIKSQGLGRLTGKIAGFGTMKQPKLPFYGELPKDQRARERQLHKILTNTGNFEAKMSLLALLSHPKTALGNIFGGSQNTISNAGFRNFAKAYDTKWLLTNVFRDARLKDGTKISDKNTIRRWISEVGALESFYVTEASMDKSLSVTKLRPFISEVTKKLSTTELSDTSIKEIAIKHRVWDSIVASGGYFMRTSESRLRGDAFMAHYLQARETLGQIIPHLEFNNPYLIRQALKGVEATQFLYHNVNRPAIARSAMGKMLTRFQPFAWNSVRFRRNIYKMAKRYGMTDKQSVDRLKRFVTQDLMVASLANIFVASIFDSIMPPPLSWAQDTANLLFGDPKERENAFFSSYPHPALAPLQAITAPVHRYYLPVITALINGDWDKYTSYYVHTLYPGGRLARSLYKTFESPEMFPEFMLGIPVHKLGANLRKNRKENEVE